MSEFFLELFSEEIPSRLQINARNDLTQILKKFFEEFSNISKIYSDFKKKLDSIKSENLFGKTNGDITRAVL